MEVKPPWNRYHHSLGSSPLPINLSSLCPHLQSTGRMTEVNGCPIPSTSCEVYQGARYRCGSRDGDGCLAHHCVVQFAHGQCADQY